MTSTTPSERSASLMLLRDALSAPAEQRLEMVDGAAAEWMIYELAEAEVAIGFVETRRRHSAVLVGDRVERSSDDPDAGKSVFTDVVVSASGRVTDFVVDGYRVSEAMQTFVGGDHRAMLRRMGRLHLVVWPPTMLQDTGWRARKKRAFVIGRVGVTTGLVSHRIVWSRSFVRGGNIAGSFSFAQGSDADEYIRKAGGFVLIHGDQALAFQLTSLTPAWSQGWPERAEPTAPVRHRQAIMATIAEVSDALSVLDGEAREAVLRQIGDRLQARPSHDDLLAATAIVLTANGLH